MCYYGNMGVEIHWNKGQHKKLTLENKILPPLARSRTLNFLSWVRHSNDSYPCCIIEQSKSLWVLQMEERWDSNWRTNFTDLKPIFIWILTSWCYCWSTNMVVAVAGSAAHACPQRLLRNWRTAMCWWETTLGSMNVKLANVSASPSLSGRLWMGTLNTSLKRMCLSWSCVPCIYSHAWWEFP